MISEEYAIKLVSVDQKLLDAVNDISSPSHYIDILKECIKILQPYAEKEKEKTHA